VSKCEYFFENRNDSARSKRHQNRNTFQRLFMLQKNCIQNSRQTRTVFHDKPFKLSCNNSDETIVCNLDTCRNGLEKLLNAQVVFIYRTFLIAIPFPMMLVQFCLCTWYVAGRTRYFRVQHEKVLNLKVLQHTVSL